MDLALRVRLLQAIEKWMEENCEERNWPDVLVDDGLSTRMADAARIVFDSQVAAQEYYKKENPDEQ